MFRYYNPNPASARVGDCSIRAVAKALNIDWEKAYTLIAANGYQMGDVPSSNNVWGSVLRQHNFYREVIPNTCPDCYSVRQFCLDHPIGIYVLGTHNHVVTVVDGDYYDTWDSGDEIPVYFWTR